MHYRDARFELKALSENGEFEGYAAYFGNVDHYGDVIERGAFRKTLLDKGGRVPLLWQHRVDEPIGIVELEEDELGLRVKRGWLDMGVQRAKEAYSLLKSGVLRGLSIGYDSVKEVWEGSTRILKELRLWEVSLVTFGANPLALVTDVKAVVPFQDLPLADKNTPWDADAAVARVRKWAGGDEIDWNKYRKAFLWYDEEKADTFGAYKLPIADVIDGELRAVPRAIFAAAAALQGARGGVDVPDSDMPALRRHVARYYAKMGLTAPWEQDGLELALYAIIGAKEFKYGRVLSERNLTLLRQALEALQALLDAAEPQDSTQEDKEPPKDSEPDGKSTLASVIEELRLLNKRLEVA